MTPVIIGAATLYLGDCIEVMRTMSDNSVDSIVTDPPYELGFMGKSWDASGIAYDVDMWREVLRVLKPGGHILAFSGSRTYHRMACAIEDAGFDIRDQIMWVYGSGFPKSLDVSKAIDKAAPRAGMFDAFAEHFAERWACMSIPRGKLFEHFPHYKNADSINAQISNWRLAKNVPSRIDYAILRDLIGLSGDWTTLIDRVEAERDVVGSATKARSTSSASALPTVGGETAYKMWDITAPATAAARQWDGWGTALKPAHEPICVARKPLIGTVADNVLAHGTGALNIDGSRVITSGLDGRWPANLIHDGSDEVEGLFTRGRRVEDQPARFFYCAKTSKKDRGEGNVHPTVKPTDLMAYLVRLVTPPNGTVFDPFMGSGSTGKAAMREGFAFFGVDMTPEYVEIAKVRIASELGRIGGEPSPQAILFGEAAC